MKKHISLLIVFSALILVSSCNYVSNKKTSNELVKTSMLSENINPSNTYKAIFYSKVGAMPNAMTFHLTILPIANNLDDSKDGNVLNAFIEPLNEIHYDLLTIKWESDSQLEVVLKNDMKLLNNENYYVNGKDTITIKFVP